MSIPFQHYSRRDLVDRLARVEGERDAYMLSYYGVLSQILQNAPPCWDGDQSEEPIALEYVRALEAATAEGNLADALTRHRDGCAGECLT